MKHLVGKRKHKYIYTLCEVQIQKIEFFGNIETYFTHVLQYCYRTHKYLLFNVFLFYVKSNDVDKSDKNVNKR